MPGAAIVRAGIFAGFDAFAARRGLDFRALLIEAGITEADIQDADKTIPLDAATSLFESAAERCGDPSLGIAWAEAFPQGGMGVYGYLIMNAGTVRNAVEIVARYASLLLHPIEASFEDDDTGVLAWQWPASLTAPPLQYASFLIALLVLRLRAATGNGWTPAEVELQSRTARLPASAQRLFGPRIVYGSVRNAIHFDRDVLNRRMKTADPRLLEIIRPLGDRMLAEVSAASGILHEVQMVIVKRLERGSVSLEVAAEALKMTSRALQIRLAQEGTNFEGVLNDTRQLLATRYLRDTSLSLTEIAFLLGFSELSAFTRAATRWFGTAPKAYRQQLRQRG